MPVNDNLRNLWMSSLVPTNPGLLGLNKSQLLKKRVCVKHFDKTQFDQAGVRIRYSYPCLFTQMEILHGVPLTTEENPTPKLKPIAVPSLFSWNHESEERREIKRKRTERAYQRQKKRETATLASNKKENKCDEHFFFEETIEELDIESSNKDVSVQCSLCKCEEN
ncbi:hypothetical protein evm_013390 [Chilo suppressalis]|nr:hypothetical protein evm_013390 [Chilo suppressalis]